MTAHRSAVGDCSLVLEHDAEQVSVVTLGRSLIACRHACCNIRSAHRGAARSTPPRRCRTPPHALTKYHDGKALSSVTPMRCDVTAANSSTPACTLRPRRQDVSRDSWPRNTRGSDQTPDKRQHSRWGRGCSSSMLSTALARGQQHRMREGADRHNVLRWVQPSKTRPLK